MNKKVLFLAIIAIFAIVCFTSCQNAAKALVGTKWEATEDSVTLLLEFKSDNKYTLTYSIGGTTVGSDNGTYTASSKTTGTLTNSDGATASYTISGNKLTIKDGDETIVLTKVLQ